MKTNRTATHHEIALARSFLDIYGGCYRSQFKTKATRERSLINWEGLVRRISFVLEHRPSFAGLTWTSVVQALVKYRPEQYAALVNRFGEPPATQEILLFPRRKADTRQRRSPETPCAQTGR